MKNNTYVDKLERLIPQMHKGFTKTMCFGLEESHLTMAQLGVLKTIYNMNNCKMTELSQTLGVTKSNITGMIDKLIKLGYVKRKPDLKDRRIVRIALSLKGITAINKLHNSHRKSLLKLLSRLPKKDIHHLINIIEKLTGLINNN